MADRFDVRLSRRAEKQLRKLDRPIQARVVAALALLRDEPRPRGAKALAGHPGYLRVRVADWRIVYTIDDGRLIVLVLTLGHRGDVYDRLP